MDTHKSIHHRLPSYSLLFFSIFSLLISCLCGAGLPVQYPITGYGPEDLQSENRIMELFQQWRENHGMSYEHDEESLKRFLNFKQNLKYIVESNSNRTGYSIGLNRFSDLSNEEFRERYIGKVKSSVHIILRKHTRGNSVYWSQHRNTRGSSVSSCDAPPSLDWRQKGAFTLVKDQDVTGSSEAFSPIEEIVNIDGYGNVEETEAALLCAIANRPIIVGIDGSSLDFQLYTGGIYDGTCSSNPDDIKHAVLIVGYGSEGDTDYWIVKNSWGTTWGMDGYIYIKRNTNLPYGICAMHALASYPTQTTLATSPSSPPSDSPPSPPYDPPPQPSLPPPAPVPSSPTLPPPPSPSSPPPSPPPPYHPPPPPSPPPTPSHKCGVLSYCLRGQTCCCLYEFSGFCMIQGCCDYAKAVCCPESDYCCPVEYPICDVNAGLCLKNYKDNLGIALKKKKLAKHTLPWCKHEVSREVTYQPLKWRKNGYAAVR